VSADYNASELKSQRPSDRTTQGTNAGAFGAGFFDGRYQAPTAPGIRYDFQTVDIVTAPMQPGGKLTQHGQELLLTMCQQGGDKNGD
jgi:hypothetical protein